MKWFSLKKRWKRTYDSWSEKKKKKLFFLFIDNFDLDDNFDCGSIKL